MVDAAAVEVPGLPAAIRVAPGPMPPKADDAISKMNEETLRKAAEAMKKPPAPPLTPALTAMLPAAMEELMREFIQRKDLDSRVQLKFRMKALLDYAAADTDYPPNPLTKPGSDTPARAAVFMQQDSGPGQRQAPAETIGTSDLLT